MPTTKIAAAQIEITFADRERNLARMLDILTETAKNGAQLTVFPEAALSGYCFENLDEARPHAEPIPGPSTERFTHACRELNTFAIYGLLEADGDRLFNACALVGPTGLIASYRKVHLPFLGMDRFTTPGDRPFAVHDAGGINIGMHICYDGGFPEPARVMTLLGADLLVLPTNWPPGSECMASAQSTRGPWKTTSTTSPAIVSAPNAAFASSANPKSATPAAASLPKPPTTATKSSTPPSTSNSPAKSTSSASPTSTKSTASEIGGRSFMGQLSNPSEIDGD